MITKSGDGSKEEETYQQKFLEVAKNKDTLEMFKGKFLIIIKF